MNHTDKYATLRAAEAAGARIQAWRLLPEAKASADGEWWTLYGPALFSCPAHLYRVHPEDAA